MISAEVYIIHSLIKDELVLKDKNVIIVDVLRSTTSILTALVRGAKEVVPTDSVTQAVKIAKGSGNSLLCGEKNGKLIEGFHLGNSPFDFGEEKIKNKSLICTTSNGTVAITKAKLAKSCALASFNNIDAIVEYILNLNEDVTFVASGKLNNFCLEDAVLIGVIIKSILKQKEYCINDPELACMLLAEATVYDNKMLSERKVFDLLQSVEHGRYLIECGFVTDIDYCSRLNVYKEIPIFYKGSIKLKGQIDTELAAKKKMKKINLKDKI
ncbi:MAG: 2-phosphosulfolactate phosphatase [Ignavibacteria bacterium]